MASFTFHYSILISFTLLITLSIAQSTSFRPKALVIPVTKDTSTKLVQFTIQINQRTPFVPVKLTLDLGGDFLWVDCNRGYVSSTYRPIRCRSAPCNLARSKACGECTEGPKPGCNHNTCSLIPYNPFIHTSTSGELASDVISAASTDGRNPSRPATAKNVLFSCGSFLDGLAKGVKGIAGLGSKKIGLPSQLAAAFSFRRKFSVCLSSSPTSRGVVFFGEGPFFMMPNRPVSNNLIYTPLLPNPVSTSGAFFEGEPSGEYFIGVKAIRVNGAEVKGINTTLLSIDKKTGVGGTKISTVEPFLTMQTSIYNAVLSAFVKSISKVPRVKAVAPFSACYAEASLGSTRVGPAVPQIDLVLQSKSVVWSVFGANSMVRVRDGVLCLGVVDGGLDPTTSIVIGSHVIEDNFLEFDLASSRLGFSSSLLFTQTTCANFNFTSIA